MVHGQRIGLAAAATLAVASGDHDARKLPDPRRRSRELSRAGVERQTGRQDARCLKGVATAGATRGCDRWTGVDFALLAVGQGGRGNVEGGGRWVDLDRRGNRGRSNAPHQRFAISEQVTRAEESQYRC